MALGQIGMFLPSESQYQKPGTYEDALRAQATKVANYLASMDQFYENLGEAKRQYDLTLSWQKESFGQQLAFEKDKFGKTFGLQERAQTSTEKYNESMLKLKQQELGLESQKLYSTNQAQKNQITSEDLLKFMAENSAAERQNALDLIGAGSSKAGAVGTGSGMIDFGDLQARVVPRYGEYEYVGKYVEGLNI